MGELLDKLILFLCCVLLLPLQAFSPMVPGGSIGGFMPFLFEQLFPGKNFSFCSSIGFLAAGCLRPEFFPLYSFSLL